MTPSNVNSNGTTMGNPVTRTVFDLAKFEDVQLAKPFPMPAKPATLEEALAAVGNDQSKLLDAVYKGIVAAARDEAYSDINGFTVADDSGKPSDEPYSGKFADEKMGKQINLTVLNLAKLQAAGSWDTLDKAKKDALKDSAIKMLQSNPDILKSFAG